MILSIKRALRLATIITSANLVQIITISLIYIYILVMSIYCGLFSALLLHLILLFQSSNVVSAAPLDLLAESEHILQRRSLGQCVEIFAATPTGNIPISIEKNGELRKGIKGHTFRILDVSDGHESGSKIVNIQSLQYDYYLAVTSTEEVTTISHDSLNDEGSGSVQYFSNFTIEQPRVFLQFDPSFYIMSALRDSSLKNCVISFSGETPACTVPDTSSHAAHATSLLYIVSKSCSQDS